MVMSPASASRHIRQRTATPASVSVIHTGYLGCTLYGCHVANSGPLSVSDGSPVSTCACMSKYEQLLRERSKCGIFIMAQQQNSTSYYKIKVFTHFPKRGFTTCWSLTQCYRVNRKNMLHLSVRIKRRAYLHHPYDP